MQIAISSRSYDPELEAGQMRLWDIPGEARVLGVTRVELHDTHLKTLGLRLFGRLSRFFNPPSPAPSDRTYDYAALKRIRKALDYYDVKAAAWSCESALGEASTLARARAYIRLAVDAAKLIGAPVLRITLDHAAVRRGIEPSVDALSSLVVDAELARVRLAIENDSPRASVERILGIVQGVDSPWLGVCVNFEHFDPRSPVGLFERLAARAVHVHAATYGDGRPDGVYSAYLGVLRTLGYEGAVALEYLGEAEPAEGLAAGIEELKRW